MTTRRAIESWELLTWLEDIPQFQRAIAPHTQHAIEAINAPEWQHIHDGWAAVAQLALAYQAEAAAADYNLKHKGGTP